ncbi:hypothetical protein ACHAWF_013184 [Thalassiosira exigua]
MASKGLASRALGWARRSRPAPSFASLRASSSTRPPPSVVCSAVPRAASSSSPPSPPHRSFGASAPAPDESRTPQQSRLPPDFLPTLKALHPALEVATNPYALDAHGRGESHHPPAPPDAVIYPSSVEEIQDILGLCCRERTATGDGAGEGGGDAKDDAEETVVDVVSVIPYGAGTSLEGHLSFLDVPSSQTDGIYGSHEKVQVVRKGGISLDMRNFRDIGRCRRGTSMQFMVDPGADATIGGMTACGASGTAAVKYGTMRENVLGMTAVLPPTTALSGSDRDADSTRTAPVVVRAGCDALKSSAGYNLPALLTGSEGTLGVMTEVTVKLHPVPSHVIAASCAFDDLHSAAEAVATIRATGVPVSRIELLDEVSIEAFNRSLDGAPSMGGGDGDHDDELHLEPMEAKPTLFMEFDGHSATAAEEDLSAAKGILTECGGSNFLWASDESMRRALWSARHRLYYSSIALRGSGGGEDDEGATPQSTVLTDVCVPLIHFADVISATARDVRDMGVVGPCFGHAGESIAVCQCYLSRCTRNSDFTNFPIGDGNFHCIMPLKKNDPKEYRDKVFRVVDNLTDRAILVGGTCTGEHGIGYGKKKYLRRQYGDGAISMMEALKRSIDPWNIMNPGKIVDFAAV